ncbi:disintegrin and metalloproteinase domain-containing protein 8 isoform X1 [Rousettus aegyptiacus]|uniref:disintegrin and metalloproteinase domain-containing protein 8 isoform X1 n=1 Tax=Rousettus aegyptiacus TaxID=9407 RepID=UPI00168D5253|nr:disintegrin and metalloproteinase domain-containing protein 8 isoform X1 [Rousettus aegyptiacus]
MCRSGLWLLGTLWLQVAAPSAPLPHVEQYEVVWPQRLPGPRARRALSPQAGLYPESVSYVLGAPGRTFTLHLRKNRYAEPWAGPGPASPLPTPWPSLASAVASGGGGRVRGTRAVLFQGPGGRRLHRDLHGRQWLSGDREAAGAGPLPLPGPRGGPPALRGQPQHLRRPQVGPLSFHRSELRPRRAGPGDPVVHLGVWAPPGSDRCPDCKGPKTQTPSRLRVGTPRPCGAGALTRSRLRPALRGFFQAGSAVHLIEPLDGSGEAGQHALYQAQHLRQKAGTCGVSNTSLESILGPRTSAAFRPRNRPLSRETRYVEVYVVADSQEFQQLGSREAVRRRVLEVVNHVDKLYQELRFRVVLVGLDIWNHEDKIDVSSQASATLDNFLAWRKQHLLGRHPHDNAQLITGVDFTGDTVGLAKVSTMCSQDSAAVSQDHSQNPVGVACTMAHEMGHNLGMDHDDNIQGCYCPEARDRGGCVMAARIGSPLPRRFSQCSQVDLERFVENSRTGCLANAPDPDRLVGGPVCGNGFVERGEQCDCGQPQDCRDACCNATSCRLAAGAECAHGACCRECRVAPAGTPCRPPKDACDLEEHCDGQRPACPEDAFQENGTPCPGGYCYAGTCPTLAQRCQDLWGPGARAAVDKCYAYSIPSDCRSWVPRGSRGVNKCGVLLCEGGQKPRERGSCSVTTDSAPCQALVLESGSGYEPVLDGTRCGKEQVCWKGLCQDLHVYRSRNCSTQCSGHGVCNHKAQCHCRPGWAPPSCAAPLTHAHAASRSLLPVLLPVLLLLALVLAVAGVVVYRKARRPAWRRSGAPKPALGLSNPLFHGGSSAPAGAGAPAPATCAVRPGPAPRPTASAVTPKQPPPAPPAPMCSPPFPVPVYTRQAPAQLRPAPPRKPLPEQKPKQVRGLGPSRDPPGCAWALPWPGGPSGAKSPAYPTTQAPQKGACLPPPGVHPTDREPGPGSPHWRSGGHCRGACPLATLALGTLASSRWLSEWGGRRGRAFSTSQVPSWGRFLPPGVHPRHRRR